MVFLMASHCRADHKPNEYKALKALLTIEWE